MRMSKKFLLLGLIILMIIITGILVYNRNMRQAVTVIPNTDTVHAYENDALSFCFKYPSTTSLADVSETTKNAYALNLLLQNPATNNGSESQLSPHNQMHVTANTLRDTNFEEYVSKNQPPTDALSKINVSINGLRGVKVQAHDAFDGSPTESVYILLPGSSSSSSTVVSATYYLGTSYSLDFAKITESIEIKKAGVSCE